MAPGAKRPNSSSPRHAFSVLIKAFLLCLCAAVSVGAADTQVHATVNKNVVTLDDQIALEVVVSGPHPSLPDPKLPSMPNFSVYASGTNQNVSFVNGRVSSSIVHTFVLVPRFVGKAVIGPITVDAEGGAAARTEPIEIEVRPPSAGGAPGQGAPSPRPAPASPSGSPSPSSSGSDVFIVAEVDKRKAFVNEQVILTVKFYTSVELLGNPQYEAPKISGFLAEDLPPERHGTTEHRGRRYYFSEIKTALFPAQAGRLVIGPASVKAQVRRDVTIDPFAPDFFQRFFSQGLVGGEDRVLTSDPVEVRSEPLPAEGKPQEFSGAVGRFAVSAAVDRTAVKAGEAVNLTVTIQGTGNVKALGDLKLPDMPSFRVYDTVSSMNLDRKNDLVSGSKTYKTVLIPKASGQLTIPAVTFSYFDPGRRQYLHASSLPISIKAAEGDVAASAAASPAGGPAPAGRLSQVSQDIRYLKGSPDASAATRLLEAVAGAGNGHTVPFLLFAAALSLTMVQERRASDPKGTRFRRALRSALKRVEDAERALPADPKSAASLLSEALLRFLGDKLDASASGLTLRRAQEMLQAKAPSLGSAPLSELRAVWEELDQMRFSPASSHHGRSEVPGRLKKLLRDLDREVKA